MTLHSGEVITLKNFYVADAQGVSQLVLQDSNGALWWIEDPTGAATYESIASTDVLLAASGSDAGAAAIWPWALGGIAAAGASRPRQVAAAVAAVVAAVTIRPIRIRLHQMHLPALSSPQTVKPSPVPPNPAAPSR